MPNLRRIQLLVPVTALSAAALSLTTRSAEPGVPQAPRAALMPSWHQLPVTQALQARWPWPSTNAFEGTYKRRDDDARLIRIVRGDLRVSRQAGASEVPAGADDLWMFLEWGVDGIKLEPFHARNESEGAYEVLGATEKWALARGALEKGQILQLKSDDRTIALSIRDVSPTAEISEAAWADWTYVSTLLDSDPPVHAAAADDEAPLVPDDDPRWTALAEAKEHRPGEAMEQIRALLRRSEDQRLYARRWFEAAQFARAQGDLDLAREIHRRYQPMGRCSMDTHPREAAREYADICYEQKRLGCFLQLQIQIMGNQFSRVAWSTYGEMVHVTEAERLKETGVDVERFFRGLLFQFATYPERQGELGPYRLARSLDEAGLSDSFRGVLESLAQDTTLDDYNRLRATMALYYLRARPFIIRSSNAEAQIVSEMQALKLVPSAREWLSAI